MSAHKTLRELQVDPAYMATQRECDLWNMAYNVAASSEARIAALDELSECEQAFLTHRAAYVQELERRARRLDDFLDRVDRLVSELLK